MDKELRILMLEDVPTDAEIELRELKRAGLRVVPRVVDTENAFCEALREFRPDIILSDFSMPHFDGMSALAFARELVPDVPFIFVSGTIGEEYAIRALKNGATDYVLKNNLVRLPAAVERALQDADERAARRRVEEALRESQEKYRLLWETTSDVVILMDEDTRIQYANPAMMSVFGYPPEEVTGREIAMLQPERLREAHRRGVKRYLETGVKTLNWRSTEVIALHRNGHEFPVEISFSHMDSGGKPLFAGFMRDITERKNQELKIARLSRIQAVLSGINSAIVRIRDRQELFNEACRIAKELGNFRMSWIGTLDRTTLRVSPMAWAGVDDEFVRQLRVTARDEGLAGQGTTPRAVRSKQAAWDNDFTANPDMGFIRRYAIERGVRSAISLPLLVEGELEGVFSLYAEETGFFTEDEVKVLKEMASDISFALQSIVRQERIEKLSRTRAVSSGINSILIRVRNRQELFQESCRIAVEDGQFPFAWIGVLDPATLDVTPVAWAGESAEELTRAKSSARDDIQGGKGAVGRAIRERRTVFNNDITAHSFGGPRVKEILRLGFRSQITLPLFEDKTVIGTLTMYARDSNFFDQEELKLLEELARDVSFALENIAKQQKLDKLSRVRAVLGEINAAIVRIRSKQELFEEACRIAVEAGHFPFAWLGVYDREAMQVTPVASAGVDDGFLISMQARWSANKRLPQGGGIAARAISEKKAVVVNDVQNDPRISRKQEHLERNIRSVAMLPLLVSDEAVGVLALHAREVGFFDEDEMRLLSELAGDIAFALQTIGKQEKLDYLSYYDALTGLPNRALFQERLGHQLRIAKQNGTKAALLLGDVKRFRFINESLGRHAGDALLREIAVRSKRIWPDPNNVARIAADSFAGILADLKDEAEVAHVLEKSLAEVTDLPFKIEEKELTISMTAGIAVYPTDGADADTLFANAEAALKRAKVSGERYLFYQPAMNASVAQTLLLENKMRRALEREQFVLHYQPKVDLASGRINGLEALIRWNDPETGLVPPMKFIPLLEETGMILEAGRWAILKALEDYREWRKQGLQPPRIAVNVSPIQLRQKDFVDVVREAIGSAAAGSHGLDLEITESLIMEDIEGNIAKLRAIRDMGVNIAIDDFGTGYSSLGYLAKLPVNALKIDRSFIITMAKDPDSMNIVSTIISLAHSLNLKVVAEGVDAEEQRKILRLLRCDEMQGYLFSKPLPAAQIEPLLRALPQAPHNGPGGPNQGA